jgi:aspartate carbamoyltransferase
MNFKNIDILTAEQFDKASLVKLFKKTQEMEGILKGQRGVGAKGKGVEKLMDGKIMATLFYEPSTRTRFSFEAAFLRLGGKVISGADMATTSSAKKRESLEDTGKVVSKLADVIVMRHPSPGSVANLAQVASVPVINAGDGPHQHPTQGLLDMYTIWKEFKGQLDGKTIGMVGDLKNGRVPPSLCNLSKHWKMKYVFVAPKGLEMQKEARADLAGAGRETRDEVILDHAIGEMDVILMTRLQEERFSSKEEAEKYRGVYVLTPELMQKARKDAIVIHPLPRVDEISPRVDEDPRAKYFDQVENGVVVRMALLAMVVG